MKESDVVAVFDEFKKRVIKKMGKKITDNTQLTEVGHALFPKKFKGVFSQDTVPLYRNGYFIVNTDIITGPGVHWVGLVSTAKNIYIWDSFGRTSTELLKVLSKKAEVLNKTVIDADYDAEQHVSEMLCGQISLSWLMTVDKVGIKNALKV
jgi:hypothetical protein